MIIGLIGPETSCDLIKNIIAEIDNSIIVKNFICEMDQRADSIIEECEKNCDASIFTGCGISSTVLANMQAMKPYVHIERTAINIAQGIIEIMKMGLKADEFSIDTIDENMVKETLEELNIESKKIYIKSFNNSIKEEAYVAWHESLQNEDKTKVALTSFVGVYYKLKEKNKRVIYLEPKKSVVKGALNHIKNKLELASAVDSQIAIEIMKIEFREKKKEYYYSYKAKKAEFERVMVDYIKNIRASFFSDSQGEYILFANSGAVKTEINYNELFKLQKKSMEYGLYLYIGIGMGSSAYKSEINARKALKLSESKKANIYQIDEKNILSGPLGKENILEYEKISCDEKTIDIALNSKLSTDTILKIMAILKNMETNIIDADTLAGYLEISSRSARRIINKLVEANFAKITAKESTGASGRPKALYEFIFD